MIGCAIHRQAHYKPGIWQLVAQSLGAPGPLAFALACPRAIDWIATLDVMMNFDDARYDDAAEGASQGS